MSGRLSEGLWRSAVASWLLLVLAAAPGCAAGQPQARPGPGTARAASATPATLAPTATPAGTAPLPTSTPETRSTPSPAPVPIGLRRRIERPTTGAPEIDAVIRMVSRGDVTGLLAPVEYTMVTCADEARGFATPPLCSRLSVPSGTPIEVSPGGFSEGRYSIKPNLRREFLQLFGGPSLKFYGAVETAVHPFGPEHPPPDYTVLFLPVAGG